MTRMSPNRRDCPQTDLTMGCGLRRRTGLVANSLGAVPILLPLGVVIPSSFLLRADEAIEQDGHPRVRDNSAAPGVCSYNILHDLLLNRRRSRQRDVSQFCIALQVHVLQ